MKTASHRLINMAGKRFGMITAKSFAGTNRHKAAKWNCECDCGKSCVKLGHLLRSGKTTSCGCYHRKQAADRLTTHGESKSGLWHTWKNMVDRCLNPSSKQYADYGGRGISVCDRWAASFLEFMSDMGAKPSAGMTLERVDNDAGYSPENCRWASRKDQARNKRSNVVIELDGERLVLADWAKRIGITANALTLRLYRWPLRKALLMPPNQPKGKNQKKRRR